MAEFPFLPLWTDAYLGDTTHLSTLEHGAYLMLLMTAWRTKECTLPDDDARLAKYARLTPKQWGRVKPTISEFFTIKDGRWINARLLDERDAVKRQRRQRSNAGKISALKRQNRGSTAVGTGGQRNSNTHTQTHKQTKGACGPYAFQGKVIRLNQSDYDGWQKRFHAIPDFNAELSTRDDWLAEQDESARKRWFHSTASYLLRKHTERIERQQPNGQQFTLPAPEADKWRIRVDGWQKDGFWNEPNWGPPPGDPDCQAPKEILERIEVH